MMLILEILYFPQMCCIMIWMQWDLAIKGQIPQMKEFSFPADEKLRKLAMEVCREVNPEINVFEGEYAQETSLSLIKE